MQVNGGRKDGPRAIFIPWYRALFFASCWTLAVALWILGLNVDWASGAPKIAWAPLAALTAANLVWYSGRTIPEALRGLRKASGAHSG